MRSRRILRGSVDGLLNIAPSLWSLFVIQVLGSPLWITGAMKLVNVTIRVDIFSTSVLRFLKLNILGFEKTPPLPIIEHVGTFLWCKTDMNAFNRVFTKFRLVNFRNVEVGFTAK